MTHAHVAVGESSKSVVVHNVLGPKGFLAAGIAAGIKTVSGVKDLALVYSQIPACVAGLFTNNRVKAAPVLLTRRRVSKGLCQALIVNSGNANACNGEQGLRDAEAVASWTASALGLPPRRVLVSSTGVIGVPLPIEKIKSAIPSLVRRLSADGFVDAAEAIMTTDKHPKLAVDRLTINGDDITILGMAKGAGMVHPRLATMLAFLFTDAELDQKILASLLREGASLTFNRITIDGETSTNDMLLLLANGVASHRKIGHTGKPFHLFKDALFGIMRHLAKAIVEDGEGRTKVVRIIVRGCRDEKAAEALAFKVACSPLVKTAFYGQDPNWGRIMAALGAAGISFDPARVSISFDDVPVADGGVAAPRANERQQRMVMQRERFTVTIDLHSGKGEASVLTTDLSEEYIRINAAYRT